MKQIKQGFLVAFEGLDGSGKSTVCQRLFDALTAEGYDVVLTKEPGGTATGKNIRSLVQHQAEPLAPLAEFLLFAADRAEHMQKLIKPSLAAKKIILCDRMADSSIAYQGYGRGLPVEKIEAVNSWALDSVRPQLTLYLEIGPSLAQERIAGRHDAKASVFDQEKTAFFERVAEGYTTLYRHRDDVCFIDASLNEDDCFATCYEHVKAIIEALHVPS